MYFRSFRVRFSSATTRRRKIITSLAGAIIIDYYDDLVPVVLRAIGRRVEQRRWTAKRTNRLVCLHRWMVTLSRRAKPSRLFQICPLSTPCQDVRNRLAAAERQLFVTDCICVVVSLSTKKATYVYEMIKRTRRDVTPYRPAIKYNEQIVTRIVARVRWRLRGVVTLWLS